MATTSLWHIEGRLKDLIDYVENPEKTKAKAPELQDLYNVFSYVQRPEATQEGEYITAINCLKETALRQMILTKKRYGKTDCYIAWHGYQSFKPEEVTPQLAHEIGVKLAKEMWGDRFEIIVTTHLDKEHIHCHFCFNSVSFRDGGKYNYSKAERKRLREASDRLCREYGLSVIEKPCKAPSRPVWLDEKSGKPTRYNVYRADVREAIDFSRTPYYMEDYLREKGISRTSPVSTGRYAYPSTSISQGWTRWMNGGRQRTSVSADVPLSVIVGHMQRILLNVQAFEKEFARKQMDCYTEDKKKQLAAKRRELSKAKKRIAEIDALIQKIYEDNASGKLSDERYATLSLSYEEEQKR